MGATHAVAVVVVILNIHPAINYSIQAQDNPSNQTTLNQLYT